MSVPLVKPNAKSSLNWAELTSQFLNAKTLQATATVLVVTEQKVLTREHPIAV